MELFTTLVLLFITFATSATAQFGFFDQMFGGGNSGGPAHHHQAQNVRSDASWYQSQYENAHCDKYLCPGTLSCVHFPHHCPCAWGGVEEKVELGEGIAVCASRGGYREGETGVKIGLARRGVL